MIKICFVCTGNTCRSIMAERILKKLVKGRKDIKVSSKGLAATGENIADNAKTVLKRMGASGTNRKSQKLTKPKADTIYITMNERQASQIKADKVMSFETLIGRAVPDPYGQDEQVYQQTADLLLCGAKKICEILTKEGGQN